MASVRTSLPLQIAKVRATSFLMWIGITFFPGKRDLFAHTGTRKRDLRTDLDTIATRGAKFALTLVEPAELKSLKSPQLGYELRLRGIE